MGFNRSGPHEQPLAKSKKKEHICLKCECKLESKGLLDAHMQIHVEYMYTCEKCGKEFMKNEELSNHI